VKRLVLLIVVSGCAATLVAQEPARFRSTSALVMVDVLVTDDRRPVTGLTRQDFELLDNGVAQTIQQIYVEQLPVNVILVLDTSGSVDGERLTSLKNGATSIVGHLRPKDRAAIVTFSHRLDLRSALTADREALRRSITALSADGSTALRDAAYAGLALRAADPTRTLLLLFSDGVDTGSILDEPRILEIARRSDATIYGIAARDAPPSPSAFRRFPTTPPRTTVDDEFLTRLARETGGRLLHADQNRDIERTFTRVLEEFNSRYILGFAPGDGAAPGWHQLEVRLRNRKGSVLARRGYFAS
jgi:VWFA-related protein